MLISEDYRKLNEKLHRSPEGFGGSGWRWADHIKLIVRVHDVKSVLDYGCGQSTLWKEFMKKYPNMARKINYAEYDPCVKGKCRVPDGKWDLVACTDVLEHIEPEFLDEVIAHVVGLSRVAIFFNIAVLPANKELPDGRNAHLIVRPMDWWEKKLGEHLPSGYRLSYMKARNVKKDMNVLVEL